MAKLADVKKATPAQTPGQLAVADDGNLVDSEQVEPTEEQIPSRPSKATAASTFKSVKASVRLGSLSVENEKINICYYGKEGTGKTTDVLHMANLGRILVVNAESGLVARRLRTLGVKIENVVVWPDPTSGETISYDGLERLFWQIKGDLLDDPDSWVGMVWDSATEIVTALLDNVRATALEKAQRAGKDRDPFFTDLADYGTMTSQARALLRRFRDLPCHFAITALERRDTDDDGAVLYGPAVTPALISDIAGYVGIVVHTRVENDLYVGKTNPGGKFRAKDRYGLLPKLMANPTFDRVLAYINEQITVEEDPEQIEARERKQAAIDAEQARKAAGIKKSGRSDG